MVWFTLETDAQYFYVLNDTVAIENYLRLKKNRYRMRANAEVVAKPNILTRMFSVLPFLRATLRSPFFTFEPFEPFEL